MVTSLRAHAERFVRRRPAPATSSTTWVVENASGAVVAVFAAEPVAREYADAGPGRAVRMVPHVTASITLRTVHTRWLEVDVDGGLRADERDSYLWCPEVDGAEAEPPGADVETYTIEGRRRVLCVGTDALLMDSQVQRVLTHA